MDLADDGIPRHPDLERDLTAGQSGRDAGPELFDRPGSTSGKCSWAMAS